MTLPPPPGAEPAVPAEPVPGMGIIYEDDDIVVVDKPRGVAAHPSSRLDRPDGDRRAARLPGTGSRPAARPSGRASCTGSTPTPPA